MLLEQRKALLEQLAVIAFDPVHDEDISEMLEGADIKNQEDLNMVQPQTPWGNKSQKVKERSKEWITRFVDREARIKVRPDRDNLMTSWKRRANTKTFGPFHDLPTIPARQGAKTREAKRALDAVAKLDKPRQMLMCDECWGTVTPGSGLVCQGCEQVCMHLHCLPKDNRSSAQLDGWACELCVKGDVASGYAEDFIIAKRTKLHNHMWAVHKLQSFARMVPYRYQFRTLRRGVRAIQRNYRGIVFWRTQFKAKVKELRPIRIRLHNLFVYVARPEVPEHHIFQAVPPSFHTKMGQFPTSLYEQHMVLVSKEAKIANKQQRTSNTVGGDADADGHPGLPGGHTSASAGEAHSHTHNTAAHDQMSDAVRAQVELLKQGYKEYPNYFGGLGHAYQPVKLAAKDALFLTVTLIEYDWETAMEKQIYRVDMPLTCAQPHNMYASCVKEIYGPNYEHHMPQPSEDDERKNKAKDVKDGSGCSTPRKKKNGKHENLLSFCSDFNQELHLLKTNFGKTCSSILIPGAPACVDLVMTLSKVSQWPKAFVVGQQRERITQNLIWHNLTTYNQAMQPASELRGNDLPSSDEQSKLLLYLPKPVEKDSPKPTGRAETLARLTAPPKRFQTKTASAAAEGVVGPRQSQVQEELRPQGGAVSWSVIPGSTEDSMHGSVTLLADETPTSARLRRWLVVMDRMLYFYQNYSDPHPVAAVELRHFYSATLDEHGVIRLIRRKAPVDQYYLVVSDSSERNTWLRVLQKHVITSYNH